MYLKLIFFYLFPLYFTFIPLFHISPPSVELSCLSFFFLYDASFNVFLLILVFPHLYCFIVSFIQIFFPYSIPHYPWLIAGAAFIGKCISLQWPHQVFMHRRLCSSSHIIGCFIHSRFRLILEPIPHCFLKGLASIFSHWMSKIYREKYSKLFKLAFCGNTAIYYRIQKHYPSSSSY